MPMLRYEVRANYKKWLNVIKYAAPFIGKEFQVSWMMNMIGLENDPSMAVMRSFDRPILKRLPPEIGWLAGGGSICRLQHGVAPGQLKRSF